jgi:hypothetical protein
LVMILKGYDTEKNRNVREPEDLMAACAWRWLSSVLQRRVQWYKLTDVSEVLAASIIMAPW